MKWSYVIESLFLALWYIGVPVVFFVSIIYLIMTQWFL